jgi:aminopeptidase N
MGTDTPKTKKKPPQYIFRALSIYTIFVSKITFMSRILLVTFLWTIAMHLCGQSHDHYCSKAHAFMPNDVGLRASSYTQAYDIKHCRMQWYIDPAIYGISGSVTYTFEVISNTPTISFDFAKVLTIDSIIYHGSKVDYDRPATYQLDVVLPQTLIAGVIDSLTIVYHGAPPSGGLGSFTKSAHAGKPVLWTLSCPYGSQDWWPSKIGLEDKIDSVDVLITTPTGHRGASNGVLISEVDHSNNTSTFHWKHKHLMEPYLVCFSVTNYAAYNDVVTFDDGNTMPMVNYVYPESLTAAQKGTKENVKALRFFDSLFVPYPYRNEKYGHAQFGWGGGMEHQTMSFVTNFSWGLLAHELAHQWFGDYVTCKSWEDGWLNEGFATYVEGLSRERYPQANNDWINWKRTKLNSIISLPNGSVKVVNPNSVSSIFNGRLTYDKGGYLVHMLRWKIGDDHFFAGLRNYLTEHAYGYVTTADLKRHLEATSGQDLTTFFDKWYAGQGYPTYKVTWAASGSTLTIKVNQTTSHASVSFFDMPLPITIKGDGKILDLRLDQTEKDQTFVIETPFTPAELLFDPSLWLISKNTVTHDPSILSSTDQDNTSFTIHPNPASDILTLQDMDPRYTQYSIRDIHSKIIAYGTMLFSEQTIDISSIPTGTYMLELSSEKEKKVIPFVKNE